MAERNAAVAIRARRPLSRGDLGMFAAQPPPVNSVARRSARPVSIALAMIRVSLLALVLASACVESPYTAPGAAAESASPRVAKAKPEFVPVRAADRDVVALIRDALEQSRRDQRRLLVYIGATWCEPCQRFHEAVEAGQLDGELAGVRFLEFDADADGAALAGAGYDGKLIPRFVVPGADGRGTDARIEGGIKGEGAVAHIMGRLRALVG